MIKECYKDKTDIEKYCIDRILTCLKVYDPKKWEVKTTDGYYGEEIDGVYFLDFEIQNKIEELLKLENDNEKIEFVLKLEYGYLLESIKDCNWSIEKTTKNKIIFPQEFYLSKLDKNIVSMYKEYPFARGIVLQDGENYKVIDGYHRLSAAPPRAKFTVIVGKNIEEE